MHRRVQLVGADHGHDPPSLVGSTQYLELSRGVDNFQGDRRLPTSRREPLPTPCGRLLGSPRQEAGRASPPQPSLETTPSAALPRQPLGLGQRYSTSGFLPCTGAHPADRRSRAPCAQYTHIYSDSPTRNLLSFPY